MENYTLFCSLEMSNNKSCEQGIKTIVLNASKNDIKLYRDFNGPLADSEYIYNLLQKNDQCLICAEVQNYPFEFFIKPNKLQITPLDPIKTKTGIDCPEETIDLHFYTDNMLKLVNDFAIYELHTEKTKEEQSC